MMAFGPACSEVQIDNFIFHLPSFLVAADNWLRTDVRSQGVMFRVWLAELGNKGDRLTRGACELFVETYEALVQTAVWALLVVFASS